MALAFQSLTSSEALVPSSASVVASTAMRIKSRKPVAICVYSCGSSSGAVYTVPDATK